MGGLGGRMQGLGFGYAVRCWHWVAGGEARGEAREGERELGVGTKKVGVVMEEMLSNQQQSVVVAVFGWAEVGV